MPWTLVGAPTFTAKTTTATVGPVRVPASGGLSVKVASPVPVPRDYGFLWLTYASSYGWEMGRIRVWPKRTPCVYRFPDVMRIRDPDGVLVLDPESWCRRWLVAGFALTLVVLADLPEPDPSDLVIPPGLVGPSGSPLPVLPSGAAGRIAFPR